MVPYLVIRVLAVALFQQEQEGLTNQLDLKLPAIQKCGGNPGISAHGWAGLNVLKCRKYDLEASLRTTVRQAVRSGRAGGSAAFWQVMNRLMQPFCFPDAAG